MTLNTNLLLKCIIGIILSGTVLVLLQMWFSLFDMVFFWKLLVTLVILGSVASFVIAIKQDLTEDKKLKDDKFID